MTQIILIINIEKSFIVRQSNMKFFLDKFYKSIYFYCNSIIYLNIESKEIVEIVEFTSFKIIKVELMANVYQISKSLK